jgi:hypothetical protein
VAGEGAGSFRLTGAVFRHTITAAFNADPQKISGTTRPGGALAHELAHASGDRIGVDDALDRGLAVGCVGASEGAGGLKTCFAGRGPEREVGHSRQSAAVNGTHGS